MAVEFEKLKFTRDWNNSADFPTYEENEQKVRADMQALHDETKEFINETLIPSIENLAVPGAGDMLEKIYDPERKRENVYAYADQKVADVTTESIGAATSEELQSHINNQNNPHNVTAEQIANTNGMDTLMAALGAVRIQTGSYVGTGTSGKSSPCSLTFSFVPKMVIVMRDNQNVVIANAGFVWLGQDTSVLNFSLSGNTLSWWNGNGVSSQYNDADATYHWVAIG